MKKTHWITFGATIAIVLGIYAIPTISQTPPPATAAPTQNIIAVIDVAQVIRSHPDFIIRQSKLAEDVKRAEASFQKRQDDLANLQKNIENAGLRPGTDEHRRAQEDFADKVATFKKDAGLQQEKFALENSQIMYDTYKDIKAMIGRYAMANRIMQVTDYREFEPNPRIPQEVAEDMDQRLVWFLPNLNITQQIIAMNGAAYTQRTGLQPPAPLTANGGGSGNDNRNDNRTVNNTPAGQPQPTANTGGQQRW